MMVTNHHGLMQSRDEQMSEKSEATSIRSENPARIEDIFEWIEGMPLSKTTKNLARDFSDAVLMAEILKYYYPHLVNSHNYIPANSIQNKKENWNTLNRKVLTKIDLRLTPEIIDQLSHSQTGVIEKVLVDFRDKQMGIKYKDEDFENFEYEQRTVGQANPSVPQITERHSSPSILFRFFTKIKNFLAAIFGFFLAILCFWRWFSGKASKKIIISEEKTFEQEQEERRRDEEEGQLRESYAQAMEEIQSKSDVIKTLCHKVAYLEGTMKLKDTKITSLTNQIEQLQQQHQHLLQHPMEMAAATGSSIKQTSAIPKIRKRPRTQM